MVRTEEGGGLDRKRPERVDYALYQGEKCRIIIEAKKVQIQPGKEAPIQLQKYFSSTNVDYAILTNGLIWQWFQKEEDGKLLGKIPFLTINMEDLQDSDIVWLWYIHPDQFDTTTLFRLSHTIPAQEIQGLVMEYLRKNIEDPEDKFMVFLQERIAEGKCPIPLNDMRDPVRKALKEVFKTTKDTGKSRGWLDLSQWKEGHIHGAVSNPMNVRMPDNSVHSIKSFRALARIIISHVDSQQSGPANPYWHTIYIPGQGRRVFASTKRHGRFPKHNHRAKKLGLYFDLEQNVEGMISGLLNFLQLLGVPHDNYRIRRTG